MSNSPYDCNMCDILDARLATKDAELRADIARLRSELERLQSVVCEEDFDIIEALLKEVGDE